MAKQDINIGSGVNKGDGDVLREALRKTNENFTELYDALSIASGTGSFLALSDTPASYPAVLVDPVTQQPLVTKQVLTLNANGDGIEFTSEIDPDQITGIKTVATSGDYNDLINTPTLHPVAVNGQYSALSGTPALATVALSASYNDLTDRPALSQVAVSGQYYDLLNRPTVPSTLLDLISDGQTGEVLTTDGNGNFSWTAVGSSIDFNSVTNKPTTISGYGITDAFDGDYNSLSNTPTIPSFDQDLNTTDSVTFNTVTTPNLVLDGDVTTQNELFIDGGAQAIGIKSQVSIVIDGDVTFQNGTVTGLTANTFGLTYTASSPIQPLSSLDLDVDVFDFGTGNTVDMQNCSVLFNGATVQDFAPGNILAKINEFLYISSARDGAVSTNVAFDYDDNISNVRQTFYGKTSFANNGQAAIVDFTDATINNLDYTSIANTPTALSDFSNDLNFISSITQTDITTALGYTPSNFDGDYNNLTNKPTTYDEILDLTDVDNSSIAVGNVLVYRNIGGNNVWKTEPLDMQDLGNVTTTGLANGSILSYNAFSTSWEISQTTFIDGVMSLPILASEPSSPTDGMVAIASGEAGEWNPGGLADGTKQMVVYLGGWRSIATGGGA